MKTITRKDVMQILQSWNQGEISAEAVQNWAGERYATDKYDCADWESEDGFSVTSEVLAHLDMLDMNLLVQDDIPAYLEFLSAPVGDFDNGFATLKKYLESVDLEKRKRQLKEIFPYAPFCK